MAEGLLGLLFEISADPSKAQAALAELKASTVAESTEISSIWSGAMDAIAGPAGIALGAIVGLGGGMVELAHSASEVGAQLFETSKKTGIAVETLSGLRAASTEAGESFEGLSTNLAGATVLIDKAMISGKGLATDTLHALFQSTKEYNEFAALPMEERLQALLKKIFELNSVEDQNTALSVFFGKAWQSNRETLEKAGTEGFGTLIDKAKQFNQFWDQEGAERAKDFTKSWNDAKQAMSGLIDEIGMGLTAAVKSFLDAMSGLHEGGADSVVEPWIKGQEEIKKYGFALKDATVEQLKQQVAAVNTGKALDGLSIHVQNAHKSLAEMIGGEGAAGGGGAAKESDKAFDHLNKVLNDTHIILPKLETDFGELAKSLDEIAKKQVKESIDFFVKMSEGGGGLLGGGKAPTVDPFGQMTASMSRMIPVMAATENETKRLMASLLQIPPAAQQDIHAYTELMKVKQQMLSVSDGVLGALDKEVAAYGLSAKAAKAVYHEELHELADYLAPPVPDYPAAAGHFAAAAAWGALGVGVSAAGYYAGGGGGGGGRSTGSGSGGGDRAGGGGGIGYAPLEQSLAGGSLSAGQRAIDVGSGSYPGGQIIVMASTREAGQWIEKVVTQHIRNGGNWPQNPHPAPVTPGIGH